MYLFMAVNGNKWEEEFNGKKWAEISQTVNGLNIFGLLLYKIERNYIEGS